MPRLAFVLVTLLGVTGCGDKPGPAHACDKLTDGGACVLQPTVAAARTVCDGVTQYCDTSGDRTPDVACLGAAAAPPRPTTPARLTLTGFVRALESGPDTNNLTLQVIDPNLLVNGANPAFVQTLGGATTALDGQPCDQNMMCKVGSCIAGRCWSTSGGVEPHQRACDTDVSLGCVFALTDGCNHSCNDGLDGRRDDGKYCRDDGSGGTCRGRLRWEVGYTIDNVPTNRTLVVRISGPGNTANTTWVQVMRWGLQLSTGARNCSSATDNDCLDVSDPTQQIYRLDLVAAAQADWIRLALQAGLAGGVPNGQGAIFGEVRDCDDVRLSGAAVGVTPAPARLGYFSADPLALQPDVTRAVSGTDPLGRFAAWGIHTGRVTIDAAGIVGGVVTSLGREDVFVYAGTLGIVTVNGGQR